MIITIIIILMVHNEREFRAAWFCRAVLLWGGGAGFYICTSCSRGPAPDTVPLLLLVPLLVLVPLLLLVPLVLLLCRDQTGPAPVWFLLGLASTPHAVNRVSSRSRSGETPDRLSHINKYISDLIS